MKMFILLMMPLIILPLAEIYCLIRIGTVIGAMSTIGLIVATAVLGAALLRHQGLATLAAVRTQLSHGELPAIELVEGLILLITGALMLTPGFLTDLTGFALLVPKLRRAVAQSALKLLLDNNGWLPGMRLQRTFETEYWDENGK